MKEAVSQFAQTAHAVENMSTGRFAMFVSGVGFLGAMFGGHYFDLDLYVQLLGMSICTVYFGVGMRFGWLKARYESEERKLTARQDERRRPRDSFEPSERLVDFARLILAVPVDRKTIANTPIDSFPKYADLTDHQKDQIIMQLTANECVLTGVATRVNGMYHVVMDDNDNTVI